MDSFPIPFTSSFSFCSLSSFFFLLYVNFLSARSTSSGRYKYNHLFVICAVLSRTLCLADHPVHCEWQAGTLAAPLLHQHTHCLFLGNMKLNGLLCITELFAIFHHILYVSQATRRNTVVQQEAQPLLWAETRSGSEMPLLLTLPWQCQHWIRLLCLEETYPRRTQDHL